MQGFDVESKTSGISSSSTLTRPRDLTREDDKLRGPRQKSVESCETRSFVQLGEKLTTRARIQKGEGPRRLGTDATRRRQATGPGWAQAGRLGPFQSPVASPFDLAAIWAIYRPGVESHESIHSSSAAEEQRREGHHLGEERVELVN
jgi:hypothetical protein